MEAFEKISCGFCLPPVVLTLPLSLSSWAERASAPDGTLLIATYLVLLFIPCSPLYPSSSLCWPWPAQGSHTIPLGSSGHRRYAALSDVKPHKMVQRPIRRPAAPMSLQASSRWSSQATSSESAGSFSFAVGSMVLMLAERTTHFSPLGGSTSAPQSTQRHQTFGSSLRSATLPNASPCPNIL